MDFPALLGRVNTRFIPLDFKIENEGAKHGGGLEEIKVKTCQKTAKTRVWLPIEELCIL